jgi:hypothetical protein
MGHGMGGGLYDGSKEAKLQLGGYVRPLKFKKELGECHNHI